MSAVKTKPPPNMGVVACRLSLDLIRVGARTMFGQSPAAPRAVDVLLLCAVSIGAFEGRPMNAGKLSHFGEVPRGTVVRRLAALQRCGLVTRLPCGGYEPGPAITRDKSQAAVEECTRAIRRAARELSRLDA